MSLKELYSVKHPTAWLEFERGEISEDILVSNFFRDSRAFDSEGMKLAMVRPVFVHASPHRIPRVVFSMQSRACTFSWTAILVICICGIHCCSAR